MTGKYAAVRYSRTSEHSYFLIVEVDAAVRHSRTSEHSYFTLTRDGEQVGGLLIGAAIPFDGELANLIASACYIHELTVSRASEDPT